MKVKFDFNKYTKENIAMHCPTEELAKLWCDYMDENGKKWCGGISYKSMMCWNPYKEKTLYYFNEGMFGSLDCEHLQNDEILEIEDFIVE